LNDGEIRLTSAHTAIAPNKSLIGRDVPAGSRVQLNAY
jgi:hypothetical protein